MANRPGGTRRDPDRTEQTCRKCDETKPLTAYDVCRQGVSGPVYYSQCKSCRNRAAYLLMRRKVFESRYGITLERYEELLVEQNGTCRICGNAERVVQSGRIRLLSVDHDHLTGRVRGLLCSTCNQALGLFKDDPELLKRAADYLSERI